MPAVTEDPAPALLELPRDVLYRIFECLPGEDLLALSATCTTFHELLLAPGADATTPSSPRKRCSAMRLWQRAARTAGGALDEGEEPLSFQAQADDAANTAVEAVSRVLGARCARRRGAMRHPGATLWRMLTRVRVCGRCGASFRDVDNAPDACRHHPGSLFSGAYLNGVGLRWTCCGARGHQKLAVRDDHESGGCTPTWHTAGGCVAGGIADGGEEEECRWVAAALGVSEAAVLRAAGLAAGTSDDRAGAAGASAVEYHPDRRGPDVNVPDQRVSAFWASFLKP